MNMTTFSRKWDLKKKPKAEGLSIGLGETVASSEQEESRLGAAAYPAQMERMSHLMASLAELEPQKWEKESSELIGFFLDSQRVLLVSQQLAAYR
jgi:hypothetical protein